MRAPHGCPDRCGGRAEPQGTEPDGQTRWRCNRCGAEWWTVPVQHAALADLEDDEELD